MYKLIVYSEMIENLRVAVDLMNEAVRIDVEENEETENLCDELEPAFVVINKCIASLQTKFDGFEEELCHTVNRLKH